MKKLYSQRLGEIEDKCFQAALEKFGLGDFVSAEPIPYGLFGLNVSLTSTKGQFVLRGCPGSPQQIKTERFIAERLHAETKAPAPWPYQLDDSSEIFGWPYVIMPKMPGVPLESPDVKASLTDDDRIGIAGAMGGLLREMQRLRHPYCGLYDYETDTVPPLSTTYTPPWEKKNTSEAPDLLIDGSASSNASFQFWLPSRIKWYIHRAIESSDETSGRVTTAGDLKWVETLIQNCKDALLEPFEPCFVMDDFKEGNTVVTKIDGKWKVTGVFDFGTAYFGDGEADLSRILLSYGIGNTELDGRAQAFLTVYFHDDTVETIRPGFLERAMLYFLMDSAVFWYCFRKLGSYDNFPDFRAWCEPQLCIIRNNLTNILQRILNR